MNNLEEWETKFNNCLRDHESGDASHDLSHFKRVWKIAKSLSKDSTDKLVVLAACYFHDIVNYPKNDPRRSQSSVDAAIKTKKILMEMKFPREKISNVMHCIEAHSFSAKIQTETEEAMIVQDADRMESLGAIGLARTFYTAGRMGSRIFDGEDPFAKERELNDKHYAVDHFETKLLKLPSTMKTKAGKAEAKKRARTLSRFLEDLREELQ